MQDINFDCPHCGQNLDAPADMAGWTIECPGCGQKIKIPVPEGMVSTAPAEPGEKATTGLIEDASLESANKDSTVRIDVPEEFLRPAPSPRIVKIKRMR
jgi:DNA-directed RNA polymerase subunit RPC12/RpoP